MTSRISLLAMGGTIATGVTSEGALPARNADDLASGFSSGWRKINVTSRDVLKISSRGVTPQHMWELALAVQEEIDNGADGIVVTHGTDTLEETAYALAMLIDPTVPIALTGAMRIPATPGEDGPANVAAAMAVAQNPEFAAYGPVVVFQDEVHAARWVTKLHSARVAAFSSPATGPVGIVLEVDKAIPLLGPSPYNERLPRNAAPSKRVELLMSHSGADGMVIEAIADKIDGLIIAGTGGGHVPPAMTDAIINLVRSGRPVVLASRSAEPQVLTKTYGGPGGEIHLRSVGLYTAGNLSAVKARLRLIFGVSAGIPVSNLFPETGNL